ncbi:hypothetical protein Cgig2_012956 [Carnegiea gigantea]|uniref:Uncharacterized protein n=1 Tax=Carnegiea gigantea TaxID=171969 RepID=A0A9Q1GL61_9CARY|nr:hypothetical protein Cgig2_012956 [Carnegiea gigantea]
MKQYLKQMMCQKLNRLRVTTPPLDEEVLQTRNVIGSYAAMADPDEEYKWKPTKCNYCKMFGHTKEECRKKPLPRTDWRPILRQDPPHPSPTQPTTDEEGFVLVRKKAVASLHEEQSPTTQLQNSFNSLIEGEDPEIMHPRTEGGGHPLWKGSGLHSKQTANGKAKQLIHSEMATFGFWGGLTTRAGAELYGLEQ